MTYVVYNTYTRGHRFIGAVVEHEDDEHAFRAGTIAMEDAWDDHYYGYGHRPNPADRIHFAFYRLPQMETP